MPAPCQSDNLKTTSMHFCQAQGHFVRLATSVDQDHFVERCWYKTHQPFCKRKDWFGKHPGIEMDHFVERLLHRCYNAGMIVADGRADLARGEVEDALPISCLNPGT